MITFFLPTRKGSQRVINKNTRPFANLKGGLFENKLNQLVQTKKIDEIIISSNDDECCQIAEKYVKICDRMRIEFRPSDLCLDSTNLQDLIAYVPTITNADHILWGHVTTPFAVAEDYDNALECYLSKLNEGYDSLISVIELKNFLLNKKGFLINNTTDLSWPRTQDLESLYEINHVIFIAKRDIYLKNKNRIGDFPFLYEMNKIKSFDIDWEDDFKIAEAIYEYSNKMKV